MLKELFQEIITINSYYAKSKDGKTFEKKFKDKLIENKLIEIMQKTKTKSAIKKIAELENIDKNKAENLWKKMKVKILQKNSCEIVKNPFKYINNAFIFQPYGSQNFPDFIIFINKYIISIEIKFTTNNVLQKNLNKFKPMWNSNMPKPNAIYLYGVSGEKITFFKGSDIINYDTRKILLDFFDQLDSGQVKLDQKLKNLKNNFGIYPYIRRTYEHKTNKSTYININNKKASESYFSENVHVREKNVINFFKDLNV